MRPAARDLISGRFLMKILRNQIMRPAAHDLILGAISDENVKKSNHMPGGA